MLLVAGLVGAIGLARLLVWNIDRRTRRFTGGMLTVAAASALFDRRISEQIIDPAMRSVLGYNTSNLAIHLLAILTCCWLVAGLNAQDWTSRQLWRWRAFPITAAAVVAIAYPISDQSRTPADEYELGDPASLVQYWAVALCITVMFAVITVTAVRNIRRRGPDLRITLALTLLAGILGVVTETAVLVLLAVDHDWLRMHYRSLVTYGGVPVLILLAASGVPGLIEAWCHRNDPR